MGQLSLCTPSREAHVPQLLSPHAVEPVHAPELEKPPRTAMKTQHSQNKTKRVVTRKFKVCLALVACIVFLLNGTVLESTGQGWGLPTLDRVSGKASRRSWPLKLRPKKSSGIEPGGTDRKSQKPKWSESSWERIRWGWLDRVGRSQTEEKIIRTWISF